MVLMGSLSLYNCMYIFVFIIMLNIWMNEKFVYLPATWNKVYVTLT